MSLRLSEYRYLYGYTAYTRQSRTLYESVDSVHSLVELIYDRMIMIRRIGCFSTEQILNKLHSSSPQHKTAGFAWLAVYFIPRQVNSLCAAESSSNGNLRKVQLAPRSATWHTVIST